MWSGQWPDPGPAGSGRAWDSNMKLFCRPGLDIIVAGQAGPGPHNSICGSGPGQVCATAAGPGRAWASNHVCGPGLGQDFRPVNGPYVSIPLSHFTPSHTSPFLPNPLPCLLNPFILFPSIFPTCWLPGFARVPYYHPCHMHSVHNYCHHIKICPLCTIWEINFFYFIGARD